MKSAKSCYRVTSQAAILPITLIMRGLLPLLSAALGLAGLSSGVAIEKRASVDACPGYAATNIQKTDNTITADLNLGGAACNVYGTDLTDLKLLVEFQTG